MDWVQDAGAWKGVPGNDIFVIDLKASPPALIAHPASMRGVLP